MEHDWDIREQLAGLAASLQEQLAADRIEALLAEPEPTEAELAWEEAAFRRRILGICGYSPEDGLAIAVRPELDLQDAIALVRRGCDPATAAQILL